MKEKNQLLIQYFTVINILTTLGSWNRLFPLLTMIFYPDIRKVSSFMIFMIQLESHIHKEDFPQCVLLALPLVCIPTSLCFRLELIRIHNVLVCLCVILKKNPHMLMDSSPLYNHVPVHTEAIQ